MSLKKIEQVKKDRGFKLFDIIVYVAVAVLVAALFIALFATSDKSELSGIKISVRAQVVFEYEFGGTPLALSKGVEVKEDERGVEVSVAFGEDKNTVYIDKQKRTVKMTGANCNGKQCLYFAEMRDNADFIYCNPHGLKVEPLKTEIDDDKVNI